MAKKKWNWCYRKTFPAMLPSELSELLGWCNDNIKWQEVRWDVAKRYRRSKWSYHSYYDKITFFFKHEEDYVLFQLGTSYV